MAAREIQTVRTDLDFFGQEVDSTIIAVHPQVDKFTFRGKCQLHLPGDIIDKFVAEKCGVACICKKYPRLGPIHPEYHAGFPEPQLIPFLVVHFPGGISAAFEFTIARRDEIAARIRRICEDNGSPRADHVFIFVDVVQRIRK